MIPTPTFECKLVLVGDSAVGKSSIINRFVDDNFTQSLLSTIGVDFKFRKIVIEDKQIKMQIWDTAGQQIFRAIISAYYSSAHAIIAVYDITSAESFDSLKSYWLKEIENQNRSDAQVFVIGNKLDLEQKRKVDTLDAQSLISSHKIKKNYQVSAKNSTKIQQTFIDIAKILLQRNPIQKINLPIVINSQLPKESAENKGKFRQKCCPN